VGSRKVRLPEFLDNRHMKVVRLSTLGTGRLHHQEILVVLGVESTPGQVNEKFQ